jgi:acyl carrier protein
MVQAEVRARVWAYILEDFLYMRPDATVGPDESLLQSGVLDSLGVMDLVAFLEQTYGIPVESREITESNLDTLNRIADYVTTKLQASRAAAD